MTPPTPTSSPWKREFTSLVRLAAPVVAVQVGQMMMGIVDTIMVGQLPGEAVEGRALGQVAIGHAYSWFWLYFGIGALLASDPLVSQAVGAKDETSIARALQRSLVLAAVLSIPIAVMLLMAPLGLRLLAQPEGVIAGAAPYSQICAASVPALLVFAVVRQGLQAMDKVAATVWTLVAANGVNVLLNWVLVYGNLGAPRLEAVGSAWATVCSRCFVAVALLLIAWPKLRPYLRPWRSDATDRKALGRMMRIGTPIGLQHQLELGIFAFTAIMMGWISERAVAGHMVALNLAALTFMVPMGISGAAGVRVGQAVGRNDADGARRAAVLSFALGVGVMVAFAPLFLLLPETLARLWTPKVDVLAVAAVLIPIAGVFQVFDGAQVVAVGILRGLGDTRTPVITAILGFWLIGFPVGYGLAFEYDWGAEGLWWGLVAGLAAVSVALSWRVWSRLRGQIRRLLIDDSVPGGGLNPR
ncbi:MAG: MATE family efflux transporter [Planctomycetes bacterium]|nr:MATE family efflux transporter [Planctomycetota bacterium]